MNLNYFKWINFANHFFIIPGYEELMNMKSLKASAF